jgi:hemolysin D
MKPQEHNHFLPAAVEMMDRPPSMFARLITWSIILLVTIIILWSYFSKMDVIVSAQGQIVPSDKTKIIQSAEPGKIKAIHIKDGQTVKQGELLIELDSTTAKADQTQTQFKLASIKLEIARLEAQHQQNPELFKVDNNHPELSATHAALLQANLAEYRHEIAVLDNEITANKAELRATQNTLDMLTTVVASMRKEHKRQQDLAKKGFISVSSLTDSEIELIQKQQEKKAQENQLTRITATLAATEKKKALAEQSFKTKALTALATLNKEKDGLEQELIKNRQRETLQQINAPVDGTVQQLAVNTIGGVVTTAQPLMVIVPEGSQLEIDAKVPNKDIGHIKNGQDVVVKVETFNYTRYGSLQGKIAWIGQDAINEQGTGPIYPIKVIPETLLLPNSIDGRQAEATTGMNVTVDILIGQRRIIDYFIAPLLRYKDESLRER